MQSTKVRSDVKFEEPKTPVLSTNLSFDIWGMIILADCGHPAMTPFLITNIPSAKTKRGQQERKKIVTTICDKHHDHLQHFYDNL